MRASLVYHWAMDAIPAFPHCLILRRSFTMQGPNSSSRPLALSRLTARGLGLAFVTLAMLALPLAARAETCTKQPDGSTVCCDNSGVCYKK